MKPASLTVHLLRIQENYQALCHLTTHGQVAPAVKANAYGLGMDKVTLSLMEAGAKDFFVATLEEAISFRQIVPDVSRRVYVLEGLRNISAQTYVDHHIIPVVNTFQQIEFLLNNTFSFPFAIMFDTGMSRLGLPYGEAAKLSDMLKAKGCKPCLILSHLACSDVSTHSMNAIQLQNFQAITDCFPDVPASLANSGGIFQGEAFHFDLVRSGIALYGGICTDNQHSVRLDVIEVDAPVLQILNLKSGDQVGYGANWTASSDARIATIGIGYADGIMRQISVNAQQATYVDIHGEKAPIIGRVSMDTLAIDITNIMADVKEYDRVWIFNGPGQVDDLAAAAHSISYEVLTGLGARLQTTYIS